MKVASLQKWVIGISIALTGSLLAPMALGLDPEVEVLVKEARAKKNEGDLEGAAMRYYQALQIDANNNDIKRELSSVLVRAHAQEPFSEQTDSMISLEEYANSPEFPASRFSLSFLSNGALEQKDGPMSHTVLLILKKLYNHENESAIKIAQILQKKYPNHPVPYNLLGLAWEGLGDPSKAYEFFQHAIILKEDFYSARINLAELQLHLGEFEAAHQELNTVLKDDNHNRRAYLLNAELYKQEGKPELAKEWYSKASEQF